MSRFNLKRKIKLLALLIVFTVTIGITALGAPEVEPDKEGSITVTVKDGEEILKDGTVTIYKVGVPNDDYSGYVLTGDFIGADVTLDDLEDRFLALKLASYIDENLIEGIKTENINDEGKVIFSGLNVGLYLLIQTTPCEGYEPFSPFIVTVPYLFEDEYVYNVTAIEKTSLEREPETEPTPHRETEPETQPKGGRSGGGGGGGSGGGSGSGGPGDGDGSSGDGSTWDLLPLPTTGQGWAMLIGTCVLIISAIALIVLLLLKRREPKK